MLVRVVGALIAGLLALFPATGLAQADTPRRFVSERVWVDPVRDLARDARGGAPAISNLLYVNRCVGGCVLTPGSNDARANTSSIVKESTTITEFEHGDEVYDAVIECLRDVYGPYDVEIVTEDPGDDTFHHEAILGGLPGQVGRPDNVGGLAPASCEPLNNVISFSFANSLGPDVEQLCWTVAQESAHSFGLPAHVYDCLDPMTYLPGPCGRKYFRNRDIQCGEFEPGECGMCGGTAQNSHRELLRTFGEGTPPSPPEVELVYPEADSSVDDNFSIFFTALDPRLVDHVDVYINGSKYDTLPGHSYENRTETYDIDAPDLPDGYIDVEVRAYNGINEAAGTATSTVLKGEPCGSADDCFEFQECSDGRCYFPDAVGDLGDACNYDEYCMAGPCVESTDGSRCSQECNLNVSDACPEGFFCLSPGYCWPNDTGGGCCAVAGGESRDDSFPLVLLSLFAGAVLMLRRRRLS
jgi:hypothetical protein